MKRRDFLRTTAACGASLSLFGTGCFQKLSPRKPNVVLILADDLGYGDLGCYGQTRFETPHLDRLAAEGMRFTDFYAGSTVCAPSRSSLMTGQHTGHTPIRGNRAVQPEGQEPLPAAATTIAELLKNAGYRTGAFGKWGLGPPLSEGDPNHQGFDEFFGYNCQRIAHHYYPWHLWYNDKKIILSENEGAKKGIYAPQLIHDRALKFIENNQREPFFLFIPSIIPHAELFAPEDYISKYRSRFEPEKSYQGVDAGERFRLGAYGSQPEAHAAFAAMIRLLDDQVGEIVAKLKELGLDKDTLFLFSSDNGPHLEGGADPDYFDSSGPLRGYKRDLYEGGIRVPLIARWPERIEAGLVSHHVSAFWDLMPTFCEMANQESPENIDGISLLPTLLKEDHKQARHDFLYWEFHEQKSSTQAVRMGKWKAFRQAPGSPLELYDLEADIGESNNIAADFPEIVGRIENYLKTARTESPLWPLKE